jgi:hypothetical protein
LFGRKIIGVVPVRCIDGLLQLVRKILVAIRSDRTLKAVHVSSDIVGEAARIGKLAWYEVLQRPGLVLKRPDPTVDSGGCRAIFDFELAEKH